MVMAEEPVSCTILTEMFHLMINQEKQVVKLSLEAHCTTYSLYLQYIPQYIVDKSADLSYDCPDHFSKGGSHGKSAHSRYVDKI